MIAVGANTFASSTGRYLQLLQSAPDDDVADGGRRVPRGFLRIHTGCHLRQGRVPHWGQGHRH